MPQPELTDTNVRHLLRRTEFVDRSERVDELLAADSFADAVALVVDPPGVPPSVSFTAGSDWERGVELSNLWLDRMAFDAPRPVTRRSTRKVTIRGIPPGPLPNGSANR